MKKQDRPAALKPAAKPVDEVEKLKAQLKATRSKLSKKTKEFNALRDAGNNFVNYVTGGLPGAPLKAKPMIIGPEKKKRRKAAKSRKKA